MLWSGPARKWKADRTTSLVDSVKLGFLLSGGGGGGLSKFLVNFAGPC